MASDPKTTALVFGAIDKLSTDFLARLLKSLYLQVPQVRPFTEIELLVPVDQVSSEQPEIDDRKPGSQSDDQSEDGLCNKEDPSVDGNGKVLLPTQKRKASELDGQENQSRKQTFRWRTCVNCNHLFDVTENVTKSCVYHPEKKEVDNRRDFWADHDEQIHGVLEDLVDEEDFQGGFHWTCCDETGDAPGCRKARHCA